MKHRVLLLDVDGVLMQQPRLFSEIYTEKHAIPLQQLLPFYSSDEFLNSSIGRYDLKQAIADHQDKWQYKGNIDELLIDWFKAEHFPNNSLLDVVAKLRADGLRIGIATQQEKYRTEYLKQQVFSGMYDDFFVSCELGLHKDAKEFWDQILALLPNVSPEEILYFDDKQSLVDLAHSAGIDAYLYESVEQVKQLAEA